MPAHLIAVPHDNSVMLQFTDASGNDFGPPDGSEIEWECSNPPIASVTQDPSNPAKATIEIPSDSVGGVTFITANVTGVNDVDGQPYSVQSLQITAFPPTPARIIYGAGV